jgi:hypothetical protein
VHLLVDRDDRGIRRLQGVTLHTTTKALEPSEVVSREGVVVISMRVGPGVEHSGESGSGAPPSSGVQPHPWSFFQARERESSVAANGEGRVLETRGGGRFLSKRQRRAWIAAGQPPLPQP